jgi:hypothetical protein
MGAMAGSCAPAVVVAVGVTTIVDMPDGVTLDSIVGALWATLPPPHPATQQSASAASAAKAPP